MSIDRSLVSTEAKTFAIVTIAKARIYFLHIMLAAKAEEVPRDNIVVEHFVSLCDEGVCSFRNINTPVQGCKSGRVWA